jgi:hypothetical protein
MNESTGRRAAETFVERVEEKLGYDVDYAPELGDDLGWFCLELDLVAQGEEFVGDVDFELSESHIQVLYAEITVGLDEIERREILNAIGERLIAAEDEETYRYDPQEAEFESLLEDLRAIHRDVFEDE